MVAALEVADEVREDAARTVQALWDRGVRPIMLSGDQSAVAYRVAAQVGIAAEDVYAGVKPAGKAAMVDRLQAVDGLQVAMVGDGVNDAAALARACVGMAMGGGVGAAAEVAPIVLMRDRLEQVVDALDLSRATFRKIRQNLGWAFGYNLVRAFRETPVPVGSVDSDER